MTEFMDKHFKHLKNGQKEYTEEEVRLIIEGAIAEEREACAKVAEEHDKGTAGNGKVHGPRIAYKIRARGQHD